MRSILLLLLLTASVVAQAQIGDRMRPADRISAMEKRNHSKLFNAARMVSASSASQNFDIKYYRCEWEVDPQVRFITGKVTSHYVMTTAGNSIAFDLADNLTVSSVTQRGISIPFSQASSTLTINFPSATGVGVKDSVSVVYSGVPSDIDGAFVADTHGTGPTLAPVIWTLSEPFGSKEWWPCKNGLDDKADSLDVYITHPSAYKAVSNGLLKTITPVAGSKSVTHWKHKYPIATYLVCLAVTNYNVLNHSVTIGADNIPMQTFCYPESQASFQAGALNALAGISFYSGLFGIYPFKNEKYGHVQFGGGGGMEHQTNSFMTDMGEELIDHELGHQWFGDKITCATWEDIWLNEGFATYLASTYAENKYPADIKANRAAEINFVTSSAGGSVRVDNVTSINRIFNSRLSYYKGAHLLYMLRWILGEAVFKTAITNYIQDPSLIYGFVTTANLKSHLETASGKNLTYFFDQWYTGQGYPSYQVEWFPVNNKVQVKLQQTTSHASVGFFQLPVPLLFRNSISNQEKLVVLNNTFSGQVFNEDLGFTPDQVVFDPDLWLITRNNSLTKASGPLPVTFISFQANCEENGVSLSWETSEEINADRFEVEKSTDARNWTVIGTVKAVGDSRIVNKYTFKDNLPGTQPRYYRILEADRDETKKYTRILSSSCVILPSENGTGELRITLAPNPVKSHLIFEAEGSVSEKLRASVYNLGGSVASAGLSNVPVGNKNNVDISALPSGLYLLVLKSDQKQVHAIRFLKE